MASWDDLSIALARLAGQDPRPLTRWPEPGSRQDQPPPFHIGHWVRHGLLVTNMTSRAAGIDTSGVLIADVVNPRTGAVTGGYSGPVHMMLQAFHVAAGQTTRVPLLVATDSFLPDLGYAIPAGNWGAQAILDPALGQAGRTPILPVTVQP